MKSSIGRGRTLDEAVDAALIELQESRRNVDVKIISENPEETVVEVAVMDQSTPAASEAATPPLAVAPSRPHGADNAGRHNAPWPSRRRAGSRADA